ncbi:DarT ssDNA thymidine ADP-ribosyltransferase family protein [Streptomyces sp. NPDC089915]|uniref:DarT ssDNA thymidine ADP-ribosyltransferase family protein n=1 Tax=Streptomyces sp. NPDC089915 TaxID=3155186 RepID=UPI003413E9A9
MTRTSGLTPAEALRRSGATRLAHFTPARSFPHILRDGAIRSSKDLAEAAPEQFTPTDRERFDRQPDKVCCTFQFPNGYYLAQARRKPDHQNYRDWICLFLDVELVLREGTLFAPCNAAEQNGARLRPGPDALLELFATTSDGWPRGAGHLQGAATNLQAEVLVPGPIELGHVVAVAMPSHEAVANELARLRVLKAEVPPLTWLVEPVLFDRSRLSSRVRNGPPLAEAVWVPPQSDGTTR